MTQTEMAERLNVSSQAVSKWENGTLLNLEMMAEQAGTGACSPQVHTAFFNILKTKPEFKRNNRRV